MTEIKENKTITTNILIVNDEEEICKILNKYLSKKASRAKFVLTGEKAIELIEKVKKKALLDLARNHLK